MERLNLPQAEYHESETEHMLRTEIWGKPPPLMVRFYIGARRDNEASDAEQAPIYKERALALVQVPGEKDCMTVEVTEEHEQRYPREWRLFQELCARPRPIPLESLPKMRPNIREALRELKINSVQDLVANDVPEYLKPWKAWAAQVNGIHDVAEGKPKPRFKVIDGQTVAA